MWCNGKEKEGREMMSERRGAVRKWENEKEMRKGR
jgi:hypothetical protein